MSELDSNFNNMQIAESSNTIENAIEMDLPIEVITRINHLKQLQEQHQQLELQFEKERRALELKYEALYQPLYASRSDVINGVQDVPFEDGATPSAEPIQGIPGFWIKTLLNHPVTEQIITERDLPCLEFLTNIESHSSLESNGFQLTFHFNPSNPYFSNTTLTKQYDVMEGANGDAMLKNITGTTIEWKQGKNLCEKKKKIKQKSKSGRETRMVTKVELCESFFQFFTTMKMPEEEDEENEENEELMAQLDADFQIGFTIHENIIPQAILWFTGEAEYGGDSEYDPEEDEDEEYDDEDLSDDDDDVDNDGIEVEDHKRSKNKNTKNFPSLETGENSTEKPPECKNQ